MFIPQAFPFSHFFLGGAVPFTIDTVEAVRAAWLLTQSTSCSSCLGFIWLLLFFRLPLVGWKCSEKRIRGFSFGCVMVHRDCSLGNLQVKVITLFLQMGKRRPSERKPKIKMCATETSPQGYFWQLPFS